jgi:hypothetical protein
MKLLQIAFVAALGAICVATYVTSETMQMLCDVSAQVISPAPTHH